MVDNRGWWTYGLMDDIATVNSSILSNHPINELMWNNHDDTITHPVMQSVYNYPLVYSISMANVDYLIVPLIQ